jgi:hypothetical protein
MKSIWITGEGIGCDNKKWRKTATDMGFYTPWEVEWQMHILSKRKILHLLHSLFSEPFCEPQPRQSWQRWASISPCSIVAAPPPG